MSTSALIEQVRRCISDDEVKIDVNDETLEKCENQKHILPAVALLTTVIEKDPEAIYSLSLEKWGCTDRDLEHIAPALGKCKDLEYLCLSENDVTENGVRALASALKGCPQLHTLLIDCNPLGHRGAAVLAEEAFPSLNSLNILFMDNTDMGDKGAEVVFQALPSSVKTASFSGNRLTDDSVKVLARVLPSRPVISHLFLKHNEISDYGAKVLSDVVSEKCPMMYSVALTTNSLTYAGNAYLMRQMAICPRCSFTFDENTVETTDALLKKYSVFHVTTAVETALDSSSDHTHRTGSWRPLLNDMDRMNELVKKAQMANRDPVIAVTAEVLALHKDVKVMILPALEIDRDDAALLGGAMGHCHSLQKAVFSKVTFLDGAVAELAGQIKKCKVSKLHLSQLYIDNSALSAADVDTLCSLLPQLKKLNELSLQRCHTNTEISRMVFAAVTSCRNLETFLYSGNALSHEEVAMLQASLATSSVTALEVDEAELTDEDALSFIAAVDRCPNLKNLSLKRNRFTQAGLAALRKASSESSRCNYTF